MVFGSVISACRLGLSQRWTMQTTVVSHCLILSGAFKHRTGLSSAHRCAIGAGAFCRTVVNHKLFTVRMEPFAQNTFSRQLERNGTLLGAPMATFAGRTYLFGHRTLKNWTRSLGTDQSFVSDVARQTRTFQTRILVQRYFATLGNMLTVEITSYMDTENI